MARSRRQQIQNVGAKARRGRGGGKGRAAAVGRFTRPHTGREAGRIANAEAGTEYNPEIRQLRQQAKGSRKRQGEIGQWFGQLASDYADSQSAGQEAFKTAEDATSKRLAESGARDQASLKDLSAQDASFAALVGGPTNAAGLSKMADAAAAAGRHRATLNAPTSVASAAFLTSLGGRRTAARMQGIEARGAENDRRLKILSDLAGVRKEKGQSRVANKEKIREADRAERHARISDKLSNKQLRMEGKKAATEAAGDSAYNQAIIEQARLGLAGSQASAAAQLGSARTYAGADRRTARATERSAKEARRGHEASARGQVQTAHTYSKGGGSSGGYNPREAQALLSSAGKAFKTPSAAVNYLVNRGVKLGVARKAVNAAVGGSGGRKRRRRGTGTAQGHVHR